MGLFHKEMYEYNNLERCRINIEKYMRENKDLCKKIGESNNYVFYEYKPKNATLSNWYILRQNKNNPRKVVFFGNSRGLNCVFKDHLFSLPDSMAEHNKDSNVIIIDVETGEGTKYRWFGENAELIFVMGFGRVWNQDHLQKAYVENDTLVLEVHRIKGTHIKEETPYNYEMDYKMYIHYENGIFFPKYSYEQE